MVSSYMSPTCRGFTEADSDAEAMWVAMLPSGGADCVDANLGESFLLSTLDDGFIFSHVSTLDCTNGSTALGAQPCVDFRAET